MGRNRKKSGVGSVKQDVNQVFPAPVDTAYPYSDGTYYDLYAFSQAVQEMIIGGGNQEAEEIRSMSPEDYEIRKNIYQNLGLDIDSRADQQIFADLTSMFSPSNGVIARRSISFAYNGIISIKNNSFTTTNETPDYVGFAMIARQITAAQEIARRTGKEVYITVQAAQGGKYVGFAVWPKLGYDFDIPEELQELLTSDDYGFTERQVSRGTAAFMSEWNSRGYDGYSVWREITRNLRLPYNVSGETTVYPDGRSTPALDVTREYARTTGFSKFAARQQRGVFGNGELNAEDDEILHSIWSTMRTRNGA
jgi:hypothetical protein